MRWLDHRPRGMDVAYSGTISLSARLGSANILGMLATVAATYIRIRACAMDA